MSIKTTSLKENTNILIFLKPHAHGHGNILIHAPTTILYVVRVVKSLSRGDSTLLVRRGPPTLHTLTYSHVISLPTGTELFTEMT